MPDHRRGSPHRIKGMPVLRALIVLLVWVGLGIFMGVQFHVNGAPAGIGLWHAIEISVRRYLIYALLTFPVLWLCRRFPPTLRRWLPTLAAHLAGFLSFLVLYAAIRTLSGSALDRATLQHLPVSWETFANCMRSTAYEQLTMYVTLVIAGMALQYHRASREREVREAELKRQMAEFELQILKLQLHPHFLFNAMNGIATLMARDTKTAREMLMRLSELLRAALSKSSADEVPLRDELEFVKAYLEIERMRLGERLKVELVLEEASLGARVPNMIIQPLVENAIEYGIARTRAGGTLGLETRCVEDRLRIVIVNDGPAPAPGREPDRGAGIGLGNARSRLGRLYGDAYRLLLETRPGGGARLFLEMPLRLEPAREAAV